MEPRCWRRLGQRDSMKKQHESFPPGHPARVRPLLRNGPDFTLAEERKKVRNFVQISHVLTFGKCEMGKFHSFCAHSVK